MAIGLNTDLAYHTLLAAMANKDALLRGFTTVRDMGGNYKCLICWAMTSSAVSKLRHFLRRVLSAVAIGASRRGETFERSIPLGRYSRKRPLVFSFVGRCQGLFGSEKYTRNWRRCASS